MASTIKSRLDSTCHRRSFPFSISAIGLLFAIGCLSILPITRAEYRYCWVCDDKPCYTNETTDLGSKQLCAKGYDFCAKWTVFNLVYRSCAIDCKIGTVGIGDNNINFYCCISNLCNSAIRNMQVSSIYAFIVVAVISTVLNFHTAPQ